LRTRDRRRFRAILFLGVGLAASALALPAARVHVLEGQELNSVDLRFAIRGKQTPSRNVVLVEVDEKTLSDLRLRWPYPRTLHAKLIDRLHRDGAKVIAFDVLFDAPTKQDDALIRSVERAHNVVLGATQTDGKGLYDLFGGAYPDRFGARVGTPLFPADPGGVVRRVGYRVDGVNAFSIVAAERYTGRWITRSNLDGTTAWIDYAGAEGTVPSVSYSDAVRGKVAPAFFKGKIVVVGEAEEALQDIHPTPTTPTMPGPEIQANAIATALDGFPLWPVSWWWNVFLVVGLAFLPAIVGIRARPLPTVTAALAGGAAFAVGAQLAFNEGHIVQVVYPLAGLALSAVASLGAHYLIEAFERQRTRDIFSRFVPEQVVNQVLTKTDAHLRLGGVRVTGTCMFTDLRDSTKFAESLPPEQVVEIVNRYLGELTEAILGQGGTLISYLGDGFMAIFGAPIEQDDHADRALAAAREILEERLPRFNEWFRERGYGEGFRMGIGINTGEFLAGNVGSEKRLEYTAMGDTINTASRLEGLTKESGFSAFVAESTCDALVRPVNDLVFAGEHEVRGREEKIKVWSVPASPALRPVPALVPDGDLGSAAVAPA
jgi:adenylate cyclase